MIKVIFIILVVLAIKTAFVTKKDKEKVTKPLKNEVKRSGDKEEERFKELLADYLSDNYPESTGYKIFGKNLCALYSYHRLHCLITFENPENDHVVQVIVTDVYKYAREKERKKSLENGSTISSAADWFTVNSDALMKKIAYARDKHLNVARFKCILDDSIKDDVVHLVSTKVANNVEYSDEYEELWITV